MRYSIGLLTPTNPIITPAGFPTDEEKVATVFLTSGFYIFGPSGLVNDWISCEALFYVPGVFSVVGGLVILYCPTDDPWINSYISTE